MAKIEVVVEQVDTYKPLSTPALWEEENDKKFRRKIWKKELGF